MEQLVKLDKALNGGEIYKCPAVVVGIDNFRGWYMVNLKYRIKSFGVSAEDIKKPLKGTSIPPSMLAKVENLEGFFYVSIDNIQIRNRPMSFTVYEKLLTYIAATDANSNEAVKHHDGSQCPSDGLKIFNESATNQNLMATEFGGPVEKKSTPAGCTDPDDHLIVKETFPPFTSITDDPSLLDVNIACAAADNDQSSMAILDKDDKQVDITGDIDVEPKTVKRNSEKSKKDVQYKKQCQTSDYTISAIFNTSCSSKIVTTQSRHDIIQFNIAQPHRLILSISSHLIRGFSSLLSVLWVVFQMASLSSPPPHKLSLPNFHAKRPSYPPHHQHQLQYSRVSDSSICRCSSSSSNSSSSSSFSAIQDVLRNAIKRFNSFMESKPVKKNGVVETEEEVEDQDKKNEWDWDRWKLHFQQVDQQERLISLLKSQLSQAVHTEDYEDAARLKVAITAAAMKDTVGRVVSHFQRAVKEERYHDAAFLRDTAGTGLVGWWAGMSEDGNDPYGLIIRITAEHGRYLATSYSPRQLATSAAGVPLFEIFLKMNKRGECKLQAVYLKRKGIFPDPSTMPFKASGAAKRVSSSVPTEDKNDLYVVSTDESEDENDTDDGSDLAEGLNGFKSILQDMIPGMKVKVLKVTAPEKVDRDFISKVIDQIIDDEDEEENEETDIDEEIVDMEEETKPETGQERDEIKMDTGSEMIDNESKSEFAVKVVVGGLVQKLSSSLPMKESLRVPAKLHERRRSSFSFSIENEVKQQDHSARELASLDGKSKIQGPRTADSIMLDLAKFVGREKIPLKVLKDIGELINLTLNQVQNHQPLSGSTSFRRIEIVTSPDPLTGLYIGAHGLYSSEVIQLRRSVGQWKEEDETKGSLEFYEYVEAIKLTGDPYVPAGQVAFRAKVGKRYQLPHKGIIPEEFGVVARYKGQGRLAEPGFRNPRWVDGELVILDGKYIKGGPVVGFVYWAPEYHFLVFFNRLKLQP
ncbi:protein EXECUTER 1, chloroplastic-like [Rutidosis leptorrhynchoides]